MKRIFIFLILSIFSINYTFADDYTFVFPKLQDLVELNANLDSSLDGLDLNIPLKSDTDSRERFCLLKGGIYLDHVNGNNSSNEDRVEFDVSDDHWILESNSAYLAGITCTISIYGDSGTSSGVISPFDTLIYDELISIKNELSATGNKTSFIIELYLYLSSLFIFFVTFRYSFFIFRKLQYIYPWVKNKFKL